MTSRQTKLVQSPRAGLFDPDPCYDSSKCDLSARFSDVEDPHVLFHLLTERNDKIARNKIQVASARKDSDMPTRSKVIVTLSSSNGKSIW